MSIPGWFSSASQRLVNFEAELNEWEGHCKVPHPFMEVAGEGIVEIPVGPVHAGIIEPGHFRFSAVGETIFFLEPRLSYTHKGTEKHFEMLGFVEGVKLAERVSGVSSFSHGAAYCMAVERMTGVGITEKAAAVRTVVLELERLLAISAISEHVRRSSVCVEV
jgi:Ni,Fe-hydrogenase III large subunit